MRQLRTVFMLVAIPLISAGLSYGQLSGPYDIGGGNNDYTSFVPAITALYSSGVSGPVTFNVYGGDYDEWANFVGPIPGASASNTVTFLDASGTVRINITAHLASSEGALQLDSTSYLIWDGIDIYLNQVNDSTYKCIVLKTGSSNNIFRNADMRGAGFSASTVKYGVNMTSRNCNDNLFENLHFHRHNTAFYLTGTSALPHTGNVIQNCTIDDVWNGFYLNYVNDIHIRNNDVQVNGAGATSSGYGVQLSSIASDATVNVYRNLFHNLASAGTPAFIKGGGGAGSILNVYNNFFYDVTTSGSSGFYGVYANTAGVVNFYFNSLRINDLGGTGSVRGVYKATNTNLTLNIQNNIFYFAEATATTRAVYGLSSGYAPSVLNNNAYYNDGGAAWALYQEGSGTAYATLADLQAGTAYEANGVEGNPGYASTTDLHIVNTYGLVSNAGAPIDGITDDIDGETRLATPDIGADEYTYLAPPADYAVTNLLDVPTLMPELTPVTTSARVQNRGSAAQTNVPVRLFYDGVQYAEVLVSLAVDQVDTVDFNWTTPIAGSPHILEVQSFLVGDADAANDSATAVVQVVGQPMNGTYDIGGGGFNYASFSDAVTDMTLRTIDGAVTFVVYGTTYNESVTIPAITGASATHTITFVEAADPVVITSGTATGTLRLDGAEFVTFDGIDIEATGSNPQAVRIFGGADHNAIRNGSVTGPSVAGTSNYGIYVSGGGNDYNTFQNLTISGAYYGIRLSGASGTSDLGNEVTGCTVSEGKYGIYLEYQGGTRVHDCDVQPGWASAATELYGVYVSSHGPTDTSFVYANTIHNFRMASSTSGANGIYTSVAAARLWAYNNFIYDYQVAGTGPIYGLRMGNGSAEFYFNSVQINDVATTGGTNGINGFFAAGTSTAVLMNNIIQINETSAPSYAINRNASGVILTSDYNCVYNGGANAAYNAGRDLTTNYATLAAWQAGTPYDVHSLEGDPGFLSGTNLHIQPAYSLVNAAATPITGITTDIDGNTREVMPDIGADEYTPVAYAHEYGVIGFVGLLPQYVSGQIHVISADVQNYGSSNETNVPIVLFYNGAPQDTAFLSLTAGSRDTVDLDWTAPVTNFETGTLEAKAFCPGDGFPGNDSTTASVLVVGPPLSGIYDLGGGNNDFPNFTAAVTALALQGIDGPVTFDCYDGTYEEAIRLTPITGASFTDRVTFQAHQSPLLDVVTLTSASDTAIIAIDDCDFITFDGINTVSTGTSNVGYYVAHDANYVTIKNAVVTGRDSSTTAAKGIVVSRDGCDDVTIDNCTVSGAYYGITMYVGSSSNESANLEIKNCSVSGGNYCIFLDNSPNARCHDNSLQPKGADAVDAQGVLVESQNAGDTVYVYNNRIFNLRRYSRTTSSNLSGIQVRPGSSATAYLYNNFIWGHTNVDPRQHGVINGILCGSGAIYLYHNSILMSDMDNDSIGVMAAININSSAASVTAINNILASTEDDTTYGIRRASGTLVSSHHNCFYGTSANFRVGRDGTVDYATLPEWQVLGYDANSVSGNPGFMSGSDLHIDPAYTLCESAGTALAEVTDDIDGDLRNDPPDIGADEYEGLFPPAAVTDLTVYRVGITDDVILNWTATTNANSYLVYAGHALDFPIEPATLIGTTASTSFTHTGSLAASKTFYVVIASTAAAGPSGN